MHLMSGAAISAYTHNACGRNIAANPEAGDVIPGAQGARKIRWSQAGTGKSGGVRVIYFNVTKMEIVLLVTLYAKTVKANITTNEISEVLRYE